MTPDETETRLDQIRALKSAEIAIRPTVMTRAEIEAIAKTRIAHRELVAVIRAALVEGVPVMAIREAVGAKNHKTWKKLKEEATR